MIVTRYQQIALGRTSSGTLQLVGIGADGAAYTVAQLVGGEWQRYLPGTGRGGVTGFPEQQSSSAGVPYTQIVVAQGGNSTFQVVTLGADGTLYNAFQQSSSGAWTALTSRLSVNPAGAPASIAVAQGPGSGGSNEVLQILSLTAAGNFLPAADQTGKGDWQASTWSPSPALGPYSQLSAATSSNSDVQVLGIPHGGASIVRVASESQSGHGSWTAGGGGGPWPVPGGGTWTSVFAGPGNGGNGQSGLLFVFGIDSTGAASLVTTQAGNPSSKTNDGFSGPSGTTRLAAPAGVTFKQLTGAWAGDGTFQLIGLGTDGSPYVVSSYGTNGAWAAGSIFYHGSTTFSQLVSATDAKGNIHVFGISSGSGTPTLIGIYGQSLGVRWSWLTS
ncbi:MAG: hypothetical protein R3B70_17780 [Polyangiaceae bacterium]